MKRFEISRQAESKFGELWDYYFKQGGKKLADRVLAEIYDAIQRLCENPSLGHVRADLTDEPLRFYRVYKILLIYDPASSPPYIARVYHASQDIQSRMKHDGP